MKHDGQTPQLPRGWTCTDLGSVCVILAGYGFPKRLQGKGSGDLPFFKVGDISETWKSGHDYLTRANHYLSHDEAASINAKALPAGATVFAKIGAAIALNRRSILSQPSLVDNNVMAVSPMPEALASKYLFYFMCTIGLGDFARATAVPSIRKGDVENISFPLPPLPEQRRIVAEIEKQFTRLDASVAALRRTRANLKRYRASVLHAACSGELAPTEAELARAEGREYEPADVLLERILAERRAHWEAQEKRRGKYQEPAAPDTSDLPPLPEGWVWASLAQLGEVRLGRQRSPKRATGPNMRPYMRAANVTWNGLNLSDVKEMDFTPAEYGTYQLLPGDILLAEASGSQDEVGKPAVWNGEVDNCCFQNTLIRVRAERELAPFLYCHLLSDARSGALGRAARGVGIHHLGAQRAETWAVGLPPLAEQHRIVAEVERRLSVIQQAEAAVEASLHRAERLRQSILKRAFSGQLAPQDPDDEPASVLLERIRAQREAEQKAASATRKRPPRRKQTAP